MNQAMRNAYRKFRKASELSYLEWWFKNPTVEPRLNETAFSSRETRDLFHVFKLNRRHNNGQYINGTEILEALAKSDRYEYLLEKPEMLIDIMTGDKYSFNCLESFRVTEKWLAERRK